MKKLFFGITVIVIVVVSAWNVNVIVKSQTKGMTYQFVNIEALAEDEGGDGSYEFCVTEGDCSITVSGQAGVSFVVLGVTYTIPASGSITITYSDVKVRCSTGGTFQCTTSSCVDFW